MVGWSRWAMDDSNQFATILACFEATKPNYQGSQFQDPQTQPLVAEAGVLLEKCKALARSLKVGRPSRSLELPGCFALVPPQRELSDSMAALYIRSFESAHRILHVPSFWDEYARFWDQSDNLTTGERLKMLLVIGIGSSLSDHVDSHPEFGDTVRRWIYAAQTWLSGPLEKNRLDITGIQVHCLTILARQLFSVGGDLVWMSMGSLIHRAMQMGLHRDPRHLEPMPILRAEIRRRLWATILEMAVQSSLDAWMPPRISFDEFDSEPPSNVNDEDINGETTELLPQPRDVYTATSMQLILLDSLRTRLRVVQLLNSLNFELSYADVLALSSEISNACRACGTFLRANAGAGVTSFHRNLMDYLLRRLLLPLQLPFSSKARSNPIFHYSRKLSLDTSLALVSPEPDKSFSHVLAMGGGLFREGVRTAVGIIGLELLVQTETDKLDGTLFRRSQYREALKQAIRDMVSLSVTRIQLGETNVKLHTYLSMLLAQVEAMENDSSIEFNVAKAARDSVAFCYEIMEHRVASLPQEGRSEMDVSAIFDDVEGEERLGSGLGLGMDFDLGYFLPGEAFM